MDFVTTDTELLNATLSEAKDDAVDHVDVIDYKMVTFTLAGKDYGIDIMDVKEIAKASRFTYVPNAAPFVLGVYNLRGEIIPIIDLRIFFHIPTQHRNPDAMESLLIVSVGELIFGIVVDSIDKVVGIAKKTIQPPHPIFGDINIKYILGVVESAGRLYILLDVQRIFGKSVDQDMNTDSLKSAVAEMPIVTDEPASSNVSAPVASVVAPESLDISFIASSLKNFKKYYVSTVNEDWIQHRYVEWRDIRNVSEIQLQNVTDADEFLSTFYSPCSGKFWNTEYIAAFSALMPQSAAHQIVVWNPGCGLGYETYSLACLLKDLYPKSVIRIYANDMDLLGIANAPNLAFPEDVVPIEMKKYMTRTVTGAYAFSQEIKDMIMFEYHDCTHDNPYPDVDLIVARDVMSFLPPDAQAVLLNDFSEKLKPSGCVVLGSNEMMPKGQGWLRNVNGAVCSFTHE